MFQFGTTWLLLIFGFISTGVGILQVGGKKMIAWHRGSQVRSNSSASACCLHLNLLRLAAKNLLSNLHITYTKVA